MKPSDRILTTTLFVIISSSTWFLTRSESATCGFSSIISFGDSIADTGNIVPLVLRETGQQPRVARPPYGRTFFHRPTGRCSDGRLIIDFIAEGLKLPYVEPYIGDAKNADRFFKGVNFAVAGATALDSDFLEKRGIHNPATNVSLGIQLDWFKQFLASNPDGKAFLENALILFGEIGGNDYNYPFTAGASPRAVRSLAPTIVSYIGSRIQEVIDLGAKTLLVPGNFPIGCSPLYLTTFETSTKDDYDPETGCIKWLNEFSEYHNSLLKKELERIRHINPQATVIYADYYNVVLRFYRSPDKFGFLKENILGACCGSSGRYNYNASALCATSPALSCDDPSKFANWDGVHFTEAAYKWIAKGLIEGPFTFPRFKTICSPSSSTIPGIAAQ